MNQKISKKLTIGIDARLYFQTGVGVYIRNLIHFLEKISPSNIFFHIYLMKTDFNKVKFKNKRFIKIATNAHWHSFLEQTNFLRQLYKDHLDLMHFTYFSYPAFYRRPFVITIHDLTPLLFKTGRASTKNILAYSFKKLAYRMVLRSQVFNSKAIITPTKTIKNQIIKYFGKSVAGKISSIYEGIDDDLINSKENKRLTNKFKNAFFIYVGNFYPHKNLDNLIEAFSTVNKNYYIIFAGPKNFFSLQLQKRIKKLSHSFKKKFIFFLNPTREDLFFFYKHAIALINPSLSEGFGLPLVEALYFNLPIIASKITVFKELFENNYLSFDPYDINDIASKINFYIEKHPRFKTKKLMSKFSFSSMAKKTIKTYLKIIKQL